MDTRAGERGQGTQIVEGEIRSCRQSAAGTKARGTFFPSYASRSRCASSDPAAFLGHLRDILPGTFSWPGRHFFDGLSVGQRDREGFGRGPRPLRRHSAVALPCQSHSSIGSATRLEWWNVQEQAGDLDVRVLSGEDLQRASDKGKRKQEGKAD